MICKREVKMINEINEVELYDSEEKFLGEVLLNIPPLLCRVYRTADGSTRIKVPQATDFKVTLPKIVEREEEAEAEHILEIHGEIERIEV